ncbi:MAG: glycosyltransferase family 4 protein [Chloroflexaceae bacterium]|nr:glycosyltransferase family 4 protein [Chloroflexaceae bacterium]
MHVLHIVQLYRPVPSGAARYFIEIGQRLVAEGHRVTVLTTHAFDLEHLWATGQRSIDVPWDAHDGVQVRRFRIERLPGPPLVYPVLRRLMVEIARASGQSPRVVPLLQRMARLTPRLPDLAGYLAQNTDLADVSLVHSTNISLDFFILPLLDWARTHQIPHIITPFVHLGEPHDRRIVRYYTMPHQIAVMQQSATVITQTQREGRFLEQAGVPASLLRTIGVGVTPAELSGGDGVRFRQQHNITTPMVLTIGVAAFDKGTIHVVQAMQQLWARGIAATWVQVGPVMDHFQRFMQQLPATDHAHIRLAGFVSNQERLDALAAADLFVLPSRTDSFGIVYLEAWCAGLAVIGAAAGGVPEVIRHGVNGLLVGFGDTSALATAIERLLRDRELARAMGAAGRARVHRQLTWDHLYGHVRQVYAELSTPAAQTHHTKPGIITKKQNVSDTR